jgi:uncharacterized protein (DUF433 family)
MDWRKIITTDPRVCGGKPCVRGLPITVAEILEHLASGLSAEDVLERRSELHREDIIACLQFASERDGAA